MVQVSRKKLWLKRPITTRKISVCLSVCFCCIKKHTKLSSLSFLSILGSIEQLFCSGLVPAGAEWSMSGVQKVDWSRGPQLRWLTSAPHGLSPSSRSARASSHGSLQILKTVRENKSQCVTFATVALAKAIQRPSSESL